MYLCRTNIFHLPFIFREEEISRKKLISFVRDGVELKFGVGDFVHAASDNETPFIARIKSIQDSRISLQWMYRASDLPVKKRPPKSLTNEIFYSAHFDPNTPDSLLEGIRIRFTSPTNQSFVTSLATDPIDLDISKARIMYECSKEYDLYNDKVVPINTERFNELYDYEKLKEAIRKNLHNSKKETTVKRQKIENDLGESSNGSIVKNYHINNTHDYDNTISVVNDVQHSLTCPIPNCESGTNFVCKGLKALLNHPADCKRLNCDNCSNLAKLAEIHELGCEKRCIYPYCKYFAADIKHGEQPCEVLECRQCRFFAELLKTHLSRCKSSSESCPFPRCINADRRIQSNKLSKTISQLKLPTAFPGTSTTKTKTTSENSSVAKPDYQNLIDYRSDSKAQANENRKSTSLSENHNNTEQELALIPNQKNVRFAALADVFDIAEEDDFESVRASKRLVPVIEKEQSTYRLLSEYSERKNRRRAGEYHDSPRKLSEIEMYDIEVHDNEQREISVRRFAATPKVRHSQNAYELENKKAEVVTEEQEKDIFSLLKPFGNIRVGKEFQATIPSLRPRPIEGVSCEDVLLWSPKFSDQRYRENCQKAFANSMSKRGNVVPIMILEPQASLQSDKKRVLWARVVSPVNHEGSIVIIPIDSSWPQSTDPSNFVVKSYQSSYLISQEALVLPDNLQEQALLNLSEHPISTSLLIPPVLNFELKGVNDLWMNWTEKEYNDFCVALQNLKEGSLLSSVSKAVKTKATSEVVELFYAPRRLTSNAPRGTFECAVCKSKNLTLLVCKRFFSCQFAVCSECYANLKGVTKLSETERNDESDAFERARYSHWFCKTCSQGPVRKPVPNFRATQIGSAVNQSSKYTRETTSITNGYLLDQRQPKPLQLQSNPQDSKHFELPNSGNFEPKISTTIEVSRQSNIKETQMLQSGAVPSYPVENTLSSSSSKLPITSGEISKKPNEILSKVLLDGSSSSQILKGDNSPSAILFNGTDSFITYSSDVSILDILMKYDNGLISPEEALAEISSTVRNEAKFCLEHFDQPKSSSVVS